jgi:hypothetical protein
MQPTTRYVYHGEELITEQESEARLKAGQDAAKAREQKLAHLNTPELIEQRRRRSTVLKLALLGQSVTSIWQTLLVDRKDLRLDTVVEDLCQVMRDFHDKVIQAATEDCKRHMREVEAAEARKAGRR